MKQKRIFYTKVTHRAHKKDEQKKNLSLFFGLLPRGQQLYTRDEL